MAEFNPTKTLESEQLIIRKLREDDFDALYKAMADPRIWEGHPQKERYQPSEIKKWFATALKEQALAIIDKRKSCLIGSSRYYETDFDHNETSIGYTFLVTDHWGGNTNRTLKELMFRHAWEHFDTVWLHIAEQNTRSRKAAEKIGAKLERIGEKHGISYCWYILPKGAI